MGKKSKTTIDLHALVEDHEEEMDFQYAESAPIPDVSDSDSDSDSDDEGSQASEAPAETSQSFLGKAAKDKLNKILDTADGKFSKTLSGIKMKKETRDLLLQALIEDVKDSVSGALERSTTNAWAQWRSANKEVIKAYAAEHKMTNNQAATKLYDASGLKGTSSVKKGGNGTPGRPRKNPVKIQNLPITAHNAFLRAVTHLVKKEGLKRNGDVLSTQYAKSELYKLWTDALKKQFDAQGGKGKVHPETFLTKDQIKAIRSLCN